MNSNVKRQIFGSPRQLNIDRDPSWPGARREVGDGMESVNHVESKLLSQSYSPNSTPLHVKEQSSSLFVPVKNKHLKDRCIQTEATNHVPDATKYLIEEKRALKDHLQIQIQVNQELKRLLVASVGDDLSFHYERLATDKAQLTLELDSQQKKCDAKQEELEALEITCDVWRSKFLASRMQCEELLKLKRYQERSQQEMESAVRGLLREHWERSEVLEQMQRNLLNLAEVLRLHKANKPPIGHENFTTAENCREIISQLSRHFLGKQDKSPTRKQKLMKACNTTASTAAEKYVLQLLSEQQRALHSLNLQQSSYEPVPNPLHQSATISRFHSRAVYDNVTLNCCHRCTGDIQVV